MPDINSIKGLCKDHVAGHLDFETYRKERAEILDALLPRQPKKKHEDITLTHAKPVKLVNQGFNTKLIIGGLLGLLIIAAIIFYTMNIM